MKLNRVTDMVSILSYVRNRRRENFGIILLDNAFNFIAKKVMFVGTASNCLVGTRELLVYALKKDARHVVIFHNHPSGDTSPSHDDVKTTDSFYEACKIVGIQLLDHIILGKNEYSSFWELDLMPKDKAKEKSVADS